MPEQKHNRRRLRLIRPRLQMRLILTFGGIAVLSLALQYLLVSLTLSQIAVTLPEDGNLMLEESTQRMFSVLCASLLVLLPMTMWIGMLVTHRIAGPLYRIESHLKDVLAGRAEEKCKLRAGDELQELCELVNEVTAGKRVRRREERPQETQLVGSK